MAKVALKTELQQKLGLTDLQQEILFDRLKDTDLIIEVFSDTYGVDAYSEKSIEKVSDLLIQGELIKAEYYDKELTNELLHEAIDGSTWFSDIEYEFSKQKCSALIRTGEDLSEKISKYIGREVEFNF